MKLIVRDRSDAAEIARALIRLSESFSVLFPRGYEGFAEFTLSDPDRVMRELVGYLGLERMASMGAEWPPVDAEGL